MMYPWGTSPPPMPLGNGHYRALPAGTLLPAGGEGSTLTLCTAAWNAAPGGSTGGGGGPFAHHPQPLWAPTALQHPLWTKVDSTSTLTPPIIPARASVVPQNLHSNPCPGENIVTHPHPFRVVPQLGGGGGKRWRLNPPSPPNGQGEL
ncbi:unnamed protein product [Eretmochelys imbricata]